MRLALWDGMDQEHQGRDKKCNKIHKRFEPEKHQAEEYETMHTKRRAIEREQRPTERPSEAASQSNSPRYSCRHKNQRRVVAARNIPRLNGFATPRSFSTRHPDTTRVLVSELGLAQRRKKPSARQQGRNAAVLKRINRISQAKPS